VPENTDAVALNLRRLRDASGLSLSALARRSGVAKATLSAIESGGGNPTVATLRSLADALGASMFELVAATTAMDVRVVPATSAEERGTDDVLVETFAPRGLVELYDIRYEPGRRIVYDGHVPGFAERVLVYEGRLRVGPADELVELGPGDFVAFPADRPHEYECVSDEEVRGVLVAVFPTAARGREPLHPESRR
jgi:transcriptional regulator with XRE-family HTH domain